MSRTLKLLKSFLILLTGKLSPNAIAFALLLGLFIGLTPSNFYFDSFLWLLIFIFALPMSVAAIGVLIALFCFPLIDPVSLFIGEYLLLELSFLKDFWNLFFQLPFFRLFGFNHTLMMGSCVLMCLCAYPMVRGFEFFINKARNFIEKSPKWKYLQTLFIDTEDLKKRKILHTKKGRCLVLIVFLPLFYLIVPWVLKAVFIQGIQKINQAPVEYKTFQVSFFPLSIDMESLSLADPKNLKINKLESNLKIEIDLIALLENRFLVKKMWVEDLKLNTSRESFKEADKKPNQGFFQWPKLQLPALSISESAFFEKTDMAYDQLIARLDLKESTMQKKLITDIQNIKQIAEQLKTQLLMLEQEANLLEKWRLANALNKDIKKYQKQIQAKKEFYLSQLAQYQADINHFERQVMAAKKDFQDRLKVLQEAVDFTNLTKSVLVQSLDLIQQNPLLHLDQTMAEWEDTARDKKRPGKYIYFDTNDLSRFEIQSAVINGENSDYLYEFQLKDLQYPVRKGQVPLQIDLDLKQADLQHSLIMNLKIFPNSAFDLAVDSDLFIFKTQSQKIVLKDFLLNIQQSQESLSGNFKGDLIDLQINTRSTKCQHIPSFLAFAFQQSNEDFNLDWNPKSKESLHSFTINYLQKCMGSHLVTKSLNQKERIWKRVLDQRFEGLEKSVEKEFEELKKEVLQFSLD